MARVGTKLIISSDNNIEKTENHITQRVENEGGKLRLPDKDRGYINRTTTALRLAVKYPGKPIKSNSVLRDLHFYIVSSRKQ